MSALVTVFVPPAFHGTTFEEVAIVNGNRRPMSYSPREHAGHIVIDIPIAMFLNHLRGPQGADWEAHNPEVMAWMGQEDRRVMIGNAFPGEHRPPLATKAAPPSPRVVKLIAPDGVASYSYCGQEHPVGKGGNVTVDEHVAGVLTSHGFRVAS
jgi:hypothetical protein